MAISSPGIGSGLDVSGIISKLMQVEQQPLIKLQSKEASYQTKISAYGSLQGAVSSLNTAIAALKVSTSQTAEEAFSTYKASVGDSSASATASSSAVAGTYTFEVTQLATTHRISTVAPPHILTSGSFATEDDSVTGADATLTIAVDGTSTDIDIAADTTLSELATAINNADTGATAAIEDDGLGGKVLVLTSNVGGAAGKMNLTGLSGFVFDDDSVTYELTETQAAAGGYSSADAVIAEGILQLTVGDTDHDIEITSENATLSGLRDAINDADIGVTATLSTISEHDVRLVITSNTIGTDGKIAMTGLTGFEFDPTDGSGDLSQEAADGGQEAQSSIIKLNGITITNDSNTVTDALQGVTLSLTKVSTSTSTLTITQDKNTKLSTAFASIVKAYNDLNTTMRDLGKYDADTKTGGPLLGNSTLRTVSNSIRNLFQSAISGTANTSYKYLSDLGMEFEEDGSITFDSSVLSTATTASFSSVASMAATFGSAADTLTDSMLGDEGTITAATDGAKSSISSLNRQRERLAERLTQIEARYKRQFSALDTLIASMNTTSSYLTRQLANLPGSSSDS
jgi:flagellar hook-associated protein 2